MTGTPVHDRYWPECSRPHPHPHALGVLVERAGETYLPDEGTGSSEPRRTEPMPTATMERIRARDTALILAAIAALLLAFIVDPVAAGAAVIVAVVFGWARGR